MIPALVLTAGLATRLRPLSYVRAKGALPIAGEPLVRRVLTWLHAAGVNDAVLNLHHLPHTLTGALGDGSDLGMKVRYSWETPVLGSAGGPRRALPLLGSNGADADAFLIVNGDTLTDVEIPSLVADHRSSGALVTLAVIPNTEPHKYSGVACAADGSFAGFVPRGSSDPSFHFVGVQVARPAAFASVPSDTPYEVRALYSALARDKAGSIRLFRTSAEFLDIGTPADYLSTTLVVAAREHVAACVGTGVRIAPDARVERSVLWDDVVVEEGAMLKECVVADTVVVPADTSWHGVTLRVPSGELAPGERIIEGLAVCPLDGNRHP